MKAPHVFFLPLIAVFLTASSPAAFSQEHPPADATPAAETEATPAERERRGFFGRLFGRRERPQEAATPTPDTTPDPAKIRRAVRVEEADAPVEESKIRKAVPVEEESPTPPRRRPAPTATPAATPTASPAATPTPTTPSPTATPTPEPTPDAIPEPTPEPTPESTPAAEPSPASSVENGAGSFDQQPAFVPDPQETAVTDLLSDDYEQQQRARYEAVKEQALQDEQVSELKEKADTAPAGEEKESLQAYYRALFNKMRELDESMKVRIDAMEKATMSRIDRL